MRRVQQKTFAGGVNDVRRDDGYGIDSPEALNFSLDMKSLLNVQARGFFDDRDRHVFNSYCAVLPAQLKYLSKFFRARFGVLMIDGNIRAD